MIFITTGSQKFQFNRLLEEIDRLVETKVITEEVFAQIGYSDYKPKNYAFCEFMSREEFAEKTNACDLFITHGGTGAIIGAVKKGKKVVAVPRLAKYGEHVDDHQLQLLAQFDEMSLICPCYDVAELGKALETARNTKYMEYQSNTKTIIEDIETEINDKAEVLPKEKKERITYIDVVRGIAIILVCVGHAISNMQDVREIALPHLLRWISQFHMPLFFVISGMLFSDANVKHPVKSSLHKVKAYYIPFVVYNLIFLALHNVFAALQLVNDKFNGGAYDAKQYLYRFVMVITGHRQSFGGAMWFLGSILIISLLFIWMFWFVRRFIPAKWQTPVECVGVLAFVAVGVSGYCPTAFKLNVSLYSTLFFYFGYLYKRYKWNETLLRYKWPIMAVCLILSVWIAYVSPVGIVSKYYANFWLFAITAVLGSLLIILMAQTKFLKDNVVLQYIGKKSLDIMSLHFLSFKVVSVVIILCYGLPWERLAEYPVLTGVSGAWWILYTIAGVTVSIGLRVCFDKVRSFITKRK